jgi:hypothetical protein
MPTYPSFVYPLWIYQFSPSMTTVPPKILGSTTQACYYWPLTATWGWISAPQCGSHSFRFFDLSSQVDARSLRPDHAFLLRDRLDPLRGFLFRPRACRWSRWCVLGILLPFVFVVLQVFLCLWGCVVRVCHARLATSSSTKPATLHSWSIYQLSHIYATTLASQPPFHAASIHQNTCALSHSWQGTSTSRAFYFFQEVKFWRLQVPTFSLQDF